ncbi:MAG TPA: vitamin K epoxide reductase family protein [Gaiellaceae bacterium]
MTSDRRLRAAIALLALAGAGVTAYLVYARYSGTRLVCTTGGCETVQHSKYAKAAGIPVAVLGLVAYLAVLATTLTGRIEAAAIGAAIVFAGLAFAIYLIVIQVAVIDAICQWCLASDAILAVLAVLSAERLRRLAGRP